MASLASVNPYSGGAQPVRVNHYLNAHHAEISSFFICFGPDAGCAFGTAGPLRKTAAATTASQPEIASGSAMIVDLNTNKVIYSDHPDLVRPIASISKLMTAMVVLDARLPLDEKLKVDISQTPEMKGLFARTTE